MDSDLLNTVSGVYTANTSAKDRHLALTEVLDALILALPRWVTVAMLENALQAAADDYPDMQAPTKEAP